MSDGLKILIAGASFAGLASAFWMKKLGHQVTIVEIADSLKEGGTPVNIRNNTVDIVKRMGLFDQVQSNRLKIETQDDDYEIERDVLLHILFDAVKNDVQFIFGDRISSWSERPDSIDVSFQNGGQRTFDLVFGCDGVRSDIRKYGFGADEEFSHFLKAYGSVTILNKLLIPENTSQMDNAPGKVVFLNTYNNKTDIILIFSSEEELTYDHRDEGQKRNILVGQFSKMGGRIPELLDEVKHSDNLYFDKLWQIKMPSWTRGRVALVGDAGYCASPAAGMGGSLALDGAAALAHAFEKCGGHFAAAFQEYNESLRPFIEKVQADAVDFCRNVLKNRRPNGATNRYYPDPL